MSDALTLLRNSVKNKKEFHEEDDKIVFGDIYYPKNVKTMYLIYGTGKDGKPKDYYTLECLAFLIKNRDLQHPMYVKNAGTRNISVVSRPDRRELLSYLDGEVETTSSIDKNAPLEIAMQRPLPYTKMSQQQSSSTSMLAAANLKRTINHITSSVNDDAFEHSLDPSGSASSSSSVSKLMKMTIQDENNQIHSKNDSLESSANNLQSSIIGRLTKKFDESAAESSKPITENIIPLSEELTKEKIASIKAKKKALQRKQVDIDPTASGNLSINDQHQRQQYQANKSSFDSYLVGGDGYSSSLGLTGGDENDAIMRELVKRESICRTRFTVLQSSGKHFEKDINAFLAVIKAKEDGSNGDTSNLNSSTLNNSQLMNTSSQMQSSLLLNQSQQQQLLSSQKSTRPLGYNRFDQERYGGKDETGGFSIDTKLTYQPNGGTLSLTPNPNAPSSDNKSTPYSQSQQLSQQKTNINNLSQSSGMMDKSKYQSPSSQMASGGKRQSTRPIIIIPTTAGSSSLITMYNVLDILQDLKYVPSDEKRKLSQNQNAPPKEMEILMHRRDDGHSLQFKVIDNVTKMMPEDWNRVVAVFSQGKQWQFKDWPFGYGNPAEIFSKVKGFHLKMAGIPLDPNIAKWSVTVIELDQHKRHLDRARLLTFWDELYRFLFKFKPHLFA